MKRRDYQRQRLYDWEDQEIHPYDSSGDMPLEMVEAYVAVVEINLLEQYGISRKRIRVKDGRGRTSACGSPVGRYIKMPRHTRSKGYILHEMAHVYVGKMPGGWHGPEFVLFYIRLVEMMLGRDALALRMSAIDSGLDVAELDRMEPGLRRAA